ncbi:MAG: hypothetical protein F2704_04480 [Actinobacteria bacterium]|uniref:Unannotated protein n=1 Tax=freshwater metagenome TaxID=449393 RepID=A0A6J7IML9_9ZZZZ|nr:DUF5302 domain-containing protein [Actinomycetota bacterium]MSW48032.1 hypothetical protein [Actinomycetota bacterium]MSX24330.1 hypothetical protein [Actinomycetota bacterium]MSY57504.1 hypothetical protein [Actinomycetota bacterium]MTB01013.1 hypothetical protein [Actinomycetota bacterium]
MSENKPNPDARAKFLEALEKKNQRGNAGSTGGPSNESKVGSGQSSAGAPKRFQRKSGSA